jgi:hypothetical protein
MATNACKHYLYEEIAALNPSAEYGLVKVKGVSFLINLDGKLSVAECSGYDKIKDCHICANCGKFYYVNDREKKHYIIRDDLAIIPVKQYEIEVKEFVPFAVYDDPRFGAFMCHGKSRRRFIVYFLTSRISRPANNNGSFIVDDKEVVGVMAKISDKCPGAAKISDKCPGAAKISDKCPGAAKYSLLFVNSEGECIADGVIVYAESDYSYMFKLDCGQLSGEFTRLGVNWTYTSAAALKTKSALPAAE